MKRKQYTTEQIIGFLKAHEAGIKVADLTRKHGFSEGGWLRETLPCSRTSTRQCRHSAAAPISTQTDAKRVMDNE